MTDNWKERFSKAFSPWLEDMAGAEEQIIAFIEQEIAREEESCQEGIEQMRQMSLEMENEAYERAASVLDEVAATDYKTLKDGDTLNSIIKDIIIAVTKNAAHSIRALKDE